MLLANIQRLCAEHETNLSKVERACGLSNATIRRWESASPTAENLVKVANYFGVSVDYLLGRGIHSLSEEAQKYAKQFDKLSEEKKRLAIAYLGVVEAQ